MGAAVAWPDPSGTTTGGARVHPTEPTRGCRGHLRVAGTHLAAEAPGATGAVRPGLRITRRGRLVVSTTLLLTLIAVVASAMLMMAPADASAEVVVRQGQTLSQIAATHLPGMPLDRALVQIQLANGMNTAQVQAGQTLVIPGR